MTAPLPHRPVTPAQFELFGQRAFLIGEKARVNEWIRTLGAHAYFTEELARLDRQIAAIDAILTRLAEE